MNERFKRSAILLGNAAMEKLQKANVLLFGIGGVGASLAEALARSGVGSITLVDNDTVSVSNINRQIIATDETVAMKKTEAMKERIHLINPECKVTTYNLFYLPDADDIITKEYDYVADAIDTVTAKIDIIMKAKALDIPVISSMGTGNKLHPELLKIENLHNTSVCPLCRVMRTELKKRGITDVTVVYSKEIPRKPLQNDIENSPGKRQTPGSVSFVPPAAGLLMASRIIQDITGEK